MEALKYQHGCLNVLDQTVLPNRVAYIACRNAQEVAEAIKSMQVRGAPAIGIAAAYGLALEALSYNGTDVRELIDKLQQAKKILAATRPTAVNLFWALNRMESVWRNYEHVAALQVKLDEEAIRLHEDDRQKNTHLGRFGSSLISPRAHILTHCNAGALATGGYGTALGVIRTAFQEDKVEMVYADETRPLLQGARLTAWELVQDGLPVTVITDSMAGYLMQQGKVDLVIVGADRISANGDVANKIGTYSLAVLAKYHQIPFYVAAPLSTIDMSLAEGSRIVIEERKADEIRRMGDFQLVPDDAAVYNPAFDLTPSGLISAIITEKGVLRPPYHTALKKLFEGS